VTSSGDDAAHADDKVNIMLKRIPVFIAGVLALSIGLAVAADPATAMNEQVYGSQLMTQQERVEYRARLRSAQTAEERAQIRAEHHERMRERARQLGVAMPEEPPAMGAGMGPGPGGSLRMGPGGGGRNR